MDANEAREALEQIDETKHELAAKSAAPTGFYALIGLAQGLLMVSFTVPVWWQFLLIFIACMVLGLAVGWYKNVVGTWSWGNIRDPRAWSFWIMVATTVAAMITSIVVRSLLVGAICGLVVFVVYAALGPVWDRVYRRQVAERA